LTLPVLLGVVTLAFLFIHLLPGDPVQIMLGEGAQAADVEQLRHKPGLDRPVLNQYGLYLKDLASGDLGISFRFGEPVTGIILSRFPATLQLAMLSLAFGAMLAVPTGVLAARQPGGWLDRVLTSEQRC